MKRKITIKLIIIFILMILIGGIVALANYGYKDYQFLMSCKDDLKEDASKLITSVKADEIDYGHLIYLVNITKHDFQKVDDCLNKPLYQFARKLPVVQDYLATADTLFDLAYQGIDELAVPAIHFLKEHPLESIELEDGYNVGILKNYLDFAEEMLPVCEDMLEVAKTIDLSFIIDQSKVNKYLDKAQEALDIYYGNSDYVELFKTIVGDATDKTYFLIGQCTPETKAGGGFYGTMCFIYIKDGVLSFSEFDGWDAYIPLYHPYWSIVTQQEIDVFGINVVLPRDMAYCADFKRQGEVLYQDVIAKSGIAVDGVISLSPNILQRLLAVSGGEFTLDDGVVMNKDNIAKYIQSDMYFIYQGTGMVDTDDYTTKLYKEAAFGTIEQVSKNISLDKVIGYIDAISTATQKREFMIWMSNEEEQHFIEESGFSGRLNFDSTKPEVGVYFTCCDSNKIGMFLDINTIISNKRINEDGSYTYDIIVQMINNITADEIARGQGYVVGHYNGAIRGYAYLTAPMGGRIDEVLSVQGYNMYRTNYLDLDMAYNKDILIYPGQTLEFNMTITTSADVEEELKLSQTATIQEFMRPSQNTKD